MLGHATIGAEEVAFIWTPDVPNGTSGTIGAATSNPTATNDSILGSASAAGGGAARGGTGDNVCPVPVIAHHPR